MDVTIDTLYAFVLVLMRTAGLVMSMPSWGGRNVPMRIRMSLVMVLAFAVYQGAGAPRFTPPDELGLLMGQSLCESILGIVGGLAARWTLEAAAAAGGLISLATGLSYGQLVDPLNGAESNALGQMLRLLALAFAIEFGLHREAMLWLLESLRASPIGGEIALQDLMVRSLAQASYSVALAVRIAFPVLAVVGLIYIALGAIGRVVPQLGLQNLGFSVSILGGGAAVYMLAPEAAHRIGQLAVQSLARS